MGLVHLPLSRLHWQLIFVVAIGPAIAHAQPPASNANDCNRSGCHVEIMDSDFLHQPLAESGCSECHLLDTPGGEPHPPLPEAPDATPFTLTTDRDCIRCHADEAVEHDSEAATCDACHNPHGGDSKALLKDEGEKVCLDCHARELDLARAPTAQSETARGSQDLRAHGPAEESRCSPCHRVHNGPLLGQLPAGLYARYERSTYSACLDACHEPEIIEAATTNTATRFRNGTDNLHFRHVAKQKRGRACNLCHTAHRAPERGLMRRGMPFGSEVLTLEFTSTPTGGRCATTCHITLDYDLNEAIPSRMRVE